MKGNRIKHKITRERKKFYFDKQKYLIIELANGRSVFYKKTDPLYNFLWNKYY
jgi:hypothetical protein